MSTLLLSGVTGLLLGLLLHWAGFSRPDGLRQALAFRRGSCVRSALYAVGAAMAMTALLCWLAVIDVDGIAVLPLSGGVLIGGTVFGIAAGLCGFTPLTAFAGLGGGAAAEGLCAIAGCLLAGQLLPLLEGPLSALGQLPPLSAATVFEVTLDEPFLLDGGFLGQGCAGLLLAVIAACIPMPRMPVVRTPDAPSEPDPGSIAEGVPAPEAEPDAAPADAEEPPPDPAEGSPAPLLLPAAAPEETFIALLPGEEPLVVDTLLDEPQEDPPTSPDDPESPAAQDPDESPASPPPNEPVPEDNAEP